MNQFLRRPLDVLMAQVETASPLEWQVHWHWNLPLWLTVLIAAGALIWVAAIYFQEASPAGKRIRALLVSLRVAALAIVLLMFAQPTLQWFSLKRPRLVVLLDRSTSMGTTDQYRKGTSEISRIRAWQRLLSNEESSLISAWQANYELDVVVFDHRIERIPSETSPLRQQLQAIEPNTEPSTSTRLGDAIDYSLRELPGSLPVAIVVFTDGIVTQGQSLQQAAQQARRMRVPLYTVAVGSERQRPDVAIEGLLVEEIVFPGDRLQVEASVRATGFAGEQVAVTLRNSDSREILAQTTFELPADGETVPVRLSVRPIEPGALALELAIDQLDEETDLENNLARQVIEVRDDKIQVLLVQSQPSYEYRALKSLLERDPAVNLRVFLQEADPEFSTVDETAVRSFPLGKQLLSYDVLILGDVDPTMLPRSIWTQIEKFVVEHGGGMIGIAGPKFMPHEFRGIDSLEVLLPLQLEAVNPLRSQVNGAETFAVSPTHLGWRSPSLQLGETLIESERIWRNLPPVTWMLRADAMKPGAQVLAENPSLTNREGQRLPVILRHYVGAGEVLFHTTDETWRWRWRSDERYFARYWGQVIRRLGRGRLAAGRQGVQLTTDRSLYEPGERVQLQAKFLNPANAPAEDDEVLLQLEAEAGPSRQIALQRRLGRRGLFSTNVENLPSGEYEALLLKPNLKGPTDVARFAVRQPPRELAELVVNRQGLNQAAEISGGKSYTVEDISRLATELPPPRQQATNRRLPQSLWNGHATMGLLVVLLTSEWILRRRYGML